MPFQKNVRLYFKRLRTEAIREKLKYLDDVFEYEYRPIVFNPLYFADQDPRLEQKEVSLSRFPFDADCEPVVGEETAELVDIPSIALDARDELDVGGAVGDAEEEFQSVLEVGAVFPEAFRVFYELLSEQYY